MQTQILKRKWQNNNNGSEEYAMAQENYTAISRTYVLGRDGTHICYFFHIVQGHIEFTQRTNAVFQLLLYSISQ